MRWPFRRNTPDTSSPASASAATSGASLPSSTPSELARGLTSAERAPQAAWRSLPPLQRSTAELTPIAPAGPFRASLSAHQDPRFLEPLGHALTADAPAGQVSGYATPAPQEVSLPAPADMSSTAGSGVGVALQRSAGPVPTPSITTYSLPSANMWSAAAVLPAVEPRPVPVVAMPPAVVSAEPVVARVAASQQHPHQDHSHNEHSLNEQVHDEQVHNERPLGEPVHDEPLHATHEEDSFEPAEAPGGPSVEGGGGRAEELPLLGSVGSLGQSPFVSALGGPQGGSEPEAVQRAVESGLPVQRAVDPRAVQRVEEFGSGAERTVGASGSASSAGIGPVVQRAQGGHAEAQGGATGKPVDRPVLSELQRDAEAGQTAHPVVNAGPAIQPAVEAGPAVSRSAAADSPTRRHPDSSLPVQRATEDVSSVPRDVEAVQHDDQDSPATQRIGDVGLIGQRSVEIGPDVQRSVQVGPDVQRSVQVGQDVQRSVEAGLQVQRPVGAGPEVQRSVEAGPEAQRPVGTGPEAQRPVRTGPEVQRSGDATAEVPRAVEVGPVVQRVGVAGVAESTNAEAGSVAQRSAGVEGVDGSSSVVGSLDAGVGLVGEQAADRGLVAQRIEDGLAVQRVDEAEPSAAAQRASAAGLPLQRSVETGARTQPIREAAAGLQRAAVPGAAELRDSGAVAQRFGEAQRAAGKGQPSAAVPDEAAADVGPVVFRSFEPAVQRVTSPVGAAELLWPPRGGPDRGVVLPLASADPSTQPLTQRLTQSSTQQPIGIPAVAAAPAVQRLTFDHPGLASRAPTANPIAPAQTPARQEPPARPAGSHEDATGDVLTWSATEQFQPGEALEPAVQRTAADNTVRAVSLQQMFSGHAMTTPPALDAPAVQRDEAPAPTAEASQPAPAAAQPQHPAAAPKAATAAEIEELAKRLYEPLTAKLRAELWLDRERAGRVTDRWH